MAYGQHRVSDPGWILWSISQVPRRAARLQDCYLARACVRTAWVCRRTDKMDAQAEFWRATTFGPIFGLFGGFGGFAQKLALSVHFVASIQTQAVRTQARATQHAGSAAARRATRIMIKTIPPGRSCDVRPYGHVAKKVVQDEKVAPNSSFARKRRYQDCHLAQSNVRTAWFCTEPTKWTLRASFGAHSPK